MAMSKGGGGVEANPAGVAVNAIKARGETLLSCVKLLPPFLPALLSPREAFEIETAFFC
jgi:hypothetical protein